MNLPLIRVQAFAKGVFQKDIPYTPVLESGDSSPYFGTYEGQRYGVFDTDTCWNFSACEVIETRLEMSHSLGIMPQEHWDWLETNGYIDSDGDIYLSRRWVAILSGVRDGGNEQQNFWDLVSVAGVIPNAMLSYSSDDAKKWLNKEAFNNDYFNPNVITIEMEQMGLEFLKRFSIQGKTETGGFFDDIQVRLQTYLKEGSIQIGHPVPQDGSWNQIFVNYPVGRLIPDHATELYKFDPAETYPYFDYDSYEPHLKQLSKNYYIPYITRVAVLPVPVAQIAQPTYWQKFWMNVTAWLRGLELPYQNIQIGRV